MLLNNKHYYNLPPEERKNLWKHYKKVYPNMGYTDMVKHFNGEVENYQFGGRTDYFNSDVKKFVDGGKVTFSTDGEKHIVYKKESPTGMGKGKEGHIMVNHPTKDKGKWDTIDLTEKANAKTVAQGVAATKKWHRENPMKSYAIGGKTDKYVAERDATSTVKPTIINQDLIQQSNLNKNKGTLKSIYKMPEQPLTREDVRKGIKFTTDVAGLFYPPAAIAGSAMDMYQGDKTGAILGLIPGAKDFLASKNMATKFATKAFNLGVPNKVVQPIKKGIREAGKYIKGSAEIIDAKDDIGKPILDVIKDKKAKGGLIKKYQEGGEDKPKLNSKTFSKLAANIPKNRLEAEAKEEYKRMHPEIEAANFYNKIQKNIEQTSEIYQTGPNKSKPTGKGALEPSYPEMMLMPGSLPIKAASKLGKAAVFAAEALNPVSGFKNMSKQLNKATKGTSNLFKEIKGELKQGKANRESIKQGNEWLENWIKHPATQSKIDANIDDKKYFATSFLKNPKQDEELFELIRTQSKSFKPNSKEYSLSKQLDNNIQQYLSKISKKPIHEGNWGVSYQHTVHPLNRNIIDEGIEKPFDRYGSWISRTTKLPQSKRVSTTIHEGTHDWVSEEALKKSGMRNIALKNTNPKIKDEFLEWEKYRNHGIDPEKKMGKERAYQAYLADPTEQHARIMELRYQLGITPDYKVTPKYAQEVIDWIDKGGSNIDPKFLKVIDKNPNKLAELFNRFWAIPAIVGTGALQQNKTKQ